MARHPNVAASAATRIHGTSRQTLRACLAALTCLGLSSLSPAQTGYSASQGKLAFTEQADFGDLDGNRIHHWQRHYRQDGQPHSGFGPGWGISFDTRLVRMPGGTVAIVGGDGGPIEYPAQDEKNRDAEAFRLARATETQHRWFDARELRGDLSLRARLVLDLGLATPSPPTGTHWRDSVCDGAGVLKRAQGYVHTPCQGPVEYFDNAGRLMGVRFKDGAPAGKGRLLHIARNAAGELLSVADDAGDRIDFEREDGLIVAARARHGADAMELRYAYGRDGRLASVTQVFGPARQRIVRTYTYDADGRLAQAGKVRFGYDAAGRIAAIESAFDSRTYAYRLSDDGTLATRMEWRSNSGEQASVVQETETDKYDRPLISYDGAGTRILFAPRTGRALMTTDTQGVERRFVYRPENRLSLVHASNGDRLQLKYGNDGLPSELKLSAGDVGTNGAPTPYGQLLAPDREGTIKLAWRAREMPTRIAWMGHCMQRIDYDPDGAAHPEPWVESATPACLERLNAIYRHLFP